MKYLLDTCVISDFVKGERATLLKVKEISPSDISISSITIMEIQYGLALNPSRAKLLRPIIHDFIQSINVLEFSQDDARETSMIRALLKQQGKPIGSYDILLAGTALNRKLTMVSANTAEFERVEGLALENWRENK